MPRKTVSFNLLTIENPKFKKGEARIAGLHLAHHDTSGFNVCPFASPGCSTTCIDWTGRGAMRHTQAARVTRTLLLLKERDKFMTLLRKDLDRIERIRMDEPELEYGLRMNATSDIAWEAIAPWIFEGRDWLHIYDYTKSPVRYNRFLTKHKSWPFNYYLTFSRSELNEDLCVDFLKRGGTATIVIGGLAREHWPREYLGFPIFDGETTDERWGDPPGHWIGLKAKGRRASVYDATGFVARFKAHRDALLKAGLLKRKQPRQTHDFIRFAGLRGRMW